MIEVARTSNPVRLAFLRAALTEAGIVNAAFDVAAGALWPGAIPSRLMVEDKDAWRARHVIDDAEAEIAQAEVPPAEITGDGPCA